MNLSKSKIEQLIKFIKKQLEKYKFVSRQAKVFSYFFKGGVLMPLEKTNRNHFLERMKDEKRVKKAVF